MLEIDLIEKYHEHIYEDRSIPDLYEIDYIPHDYTSNDIPRKNITSEGRLNFWIFDKIKTKNCIFLKDPTDSIISIYTFWFKSKHTDDVFEVVSPYKTVENTLNLTKDGQQTLMALDILKIDIEDITCLGFKERIYNLNDKILQVAL